MAWPPQFIIWVIFLFVGKAGSNQCAFIFEAFRTLSGELGVLLAENKIERPVQKLTFLEVELDSVSQCSRLPMEKLKILWELLTTSLAAKKLSLRELQVIVGHLNFACRVFLRAFLRCHCDTTVGLKSPLHRVRVTAGMKEDILVLLVWIQFFYSFNGVSLWREVLLVEANLQVHSDAAGGFGVFCRGRWCAEPWPDD